MEDEAERLEVLDRGLDREGEPETLRRPPRPERLELHAMRPGVDPRAFLAETGDQRGPVELRDRSDPAQAEAGQPGPDIEILGEEAGRVRGEERRLVTGRNEDRRPGASEDRGHGRSEAGARDASPDLASGGLSGHAGPAGLASLAGLAGAEGPPQ